MQVRKKDVILAFQVVPHGRGTTLCLGVGGFFVCLFNGYCKAVVSLVPWGPGMLNVPKYLGQSPTVKNSFTS